MALTEQDYEDAAKRLDCEVAAIKAVAETESSGDGFLPDGGVKILFERHLFSKLTGRKFDASNPDLSNRKAGGYGTVLAQPDRLKRAMELDHDAALKSASYGRFQVLGNNWQDLGYGSVQEFVDSMGTDAGQLDSFIRFVEKNGLAGALQSKNWAAFAKRYNGPNYRINKYDDKMAAAYKKYA